MMKNRALVIAVHGRRATVLLPGGKFERIRLRERAAVGQEIWVQPARPIAEYAALAAAGLLLAGVVLPRLMAPSTKVASGFSLDFAPSINFGVSRTGKVVSVHPLNAVGRRLLAKKSLIGMPATQAALFVTRSGVAQHMISTANPYLVVGGAVGSGSRAWFHALVHAEVGMVRQKGWNIEVVVAETHGSANSLLKSNISIGRYVLDTRNFAQPTMMSASQSLPSLLSQSGVMAASASPRP